MTEYRRDSDGQAYTREEFLEYYNGDKSKWEKAEKMAKKTVGKKLKSTKDAAFVPSGGARAKEVPFDKSFERHMFVPSRLKGKSADFIGTVNDWHYAMLNDHPRNEHYKNALEKVIIPNETRCLEIGAGSGILSCIAASLGAKHVVAIEANIHLVRLARQIVKANGFEDRVTIVHGMSNDIDQAKLGHKADVLLSELFGTLLLSESALHYIADAREHLVKKGAKIVPQRGVQYVQLLESPDMDSITTAKTWNGIQLEPFNTLKDTSSLIFSKAHGFRVSSIAHEYLSDRIPVLLVDFTKDEPQNLDIQKIIVTPKKDGIVHAVLTSWEAYSDGATPISTHPDDTKTNFARDMHWGQGIQLMEDLTGPDSAMPQPFEVKAGVPIRLVVTYSASCVSMQFRLEHVTG
ncbi:hypothetical protein DIPPA_54179 [Diplonema papillatum]|nr:hypothetical protein DIPPA_54179 [Diplonema papillatum]